MSFGWGEESGRQARPATQPAAGGLAHNVAGNIQKINASTADLKKLVEVIGTPRDSNQHRERIRTAIETTQKVIRDTNGQFRGAKTVTSPTEKEQIRRLGEQYTAACRAFEDLAKLAARREREVVVEMSVPGGGGGAAYGSDAPQGLAAQAQDFQSVDMELIKERNQEVAELERDLIGLHELTVDLATLVNDQQEGIDVVEENVESAGAAVREGTNELTEANKLQRKTRKKMCMIALCLVSAAAIIIIPSAVCGSGNC